jgi:hypothetical protein
MNEEAPETHLQPRLDAHDRRRFRTEDLTDKEADQIASVRMHPRHDHLDALLDPQ